MHRRLNACVVRSVRSLGMSSLLLTGLCLAQSRAGKDVPLRVRFGASARAFGEAMPTGNGRLGASAYGGIAHERISLNESSMWSGSPHDADRPDAFQQLPKIRQFLLAGENGKAEELVNQTFTSADQGGADPRYGNYQELGRVELDAPDLQDREASDYHRFLDLHTATASTSFVVHGTRYTREVFTSAPDQVIVIHLTASRPHSLSFGIHLLRQERSTTEAHSEDELLMTGELASGTPERQGVRYAARLRVVAHGGTVSAVPGASLAVHAADEVTLLITAATDFRGFAGRELSDPVAASAQDLQRAAAVPYARLRARHETDFGRLFGRVKLQLGGSEGAQASDEGTPAVERLAAVNRHMPDPSLAALYFQFGRYLLISSSRPGGLPANLQGLWAEGVRTPWNGDWHLNINLQMNYWPAESTDVSELTEPLFALIGSLQGPGAHTARSYYNADGWVAHVMTNAWGFTSPGEQASWGSTAMGSGWLCQHIWLHFLYTGDREFLRRMFPVMRASSAFYLAMLVREPKHGWLVTAPSNSPENSFFLPDGQKASVCMGPAIDEEILRALFRATADAAAVLGTDARFAQTLRSTAQQLAPIQIGPDGRVMEWLEPYREVDPHHRHVSHLWALYPGYEVDPVTTPDLAAAARKTLEARGDGATGWSLANKMLMWTRLGDGDHAYALLENLWHPVDPVTQNTAGSLPNLLDVHPPFQIDGNFGATAAIAEMLVSGRPEELRLLPALPSAWPEGHVEGLRAVGALIKALRWNNGQMVLCTLQLTRTGSLRVRYRGHVLSVEGRAGQVLTLRGDLAGLHRVALSR